jgi:transposase InsO family protein
MREAYSMVWSVLVLLFRSRVSLEAEILILRHQLNIQRRHLPKRLAFSAMDRLIFVGLYRLAPNTIKALTIVKPDTVIRWHRAGFRLYWHWKLRHRCGRPTVPLEIRRLIREMSIANPLWGAPRIHGELLKLGIEIGQTSVAKYMARRRGPPSQEWKTFLRNHADGIAAMDLFVVPTISFRLLYGLLIVGHDRRQILWLGVTAHPTTEWIANQLTEACGWEQIPRYLIRDRDRAYGEIFVRRVRSIGIRDRPTSFRSPWQNAHAERLIGSIRRECTDHIVIFGERHLRNVLLSYMSYYNGTRTHLSLNKDAPISRAAESAGRIICRPILGGLHHQYGRMRFTVGTYRQRALPHLSCPIIFNRCQMASSSLAAMFYRASR